MPRLPVALCALALCACTMEGMPADPKAPRMNQAGTCFAFVTAEGDGRYTITRGVGDGTATPMGVQRRGLSAAQVDAAIAKEREIAAVNPECLGVRIAGRAEVGDTPES
ncbi:MAG: hypothetical protein KDJ82_14575 [Rhodobacteraceae bacterium]|nr:hypothetical protein [Paracoccaceae bacterium]